MYRLMRVALAVAGRLVVTRLKVAEPNAATAELQGRWDVVGVAENGEAVKIQ